MDGCGGVGGITQGVPSNLDVGGGGRSLVGHPLVPSHLLALGLDEGGVRVLNLATTAVFDCP